MLIMRHSKPSQGGAELVNHLFSQVARADNDAYFVVLYCTVYRRYSSSCAPFKNVVSAGNYARFKYWGFISYGKPINVER